MTGKKLLSFPQWQPKTGTRQIWRVIFMGGHLLRKAARHPSWTKSVIILIWFDKGHVVINSLKIIWIFNMANSRNVYLTEKQHSRHQQFWRFPLSPLEASSRIPRHTQCQRPVHPKDLICDIRHSIKIKYPYTKPQSPTPFNSNSHPSHFCTKLWSKTYLSYQGLVNVLICRSAILEAATYNVFVVFSICARPQYVNKEVDAMVY